MMWEAEWMLLAGAARCPPSRGNPTAETDRVYRRRSERRWGDTSTTIEPDHQEVSLTSGFQEYTHLVDIMTAEGEGCSAGGRGEKGEGGRI